MNEHTELFGKLNFLVDGFPRSIENWNGWQEIFGNEEKNMPIMLFFECPIEILEERIMKRAKYSGRSDDNVESLRKRFNTYKEETMPTVEIFKVAGKAIQVDTSNARPEVYKLVHEKLA
jgi:adenylate kinase family enzyme